MNRAPRESHGVVSLAALDLRRRPEHAAELRSQLLLGETVRVLRAGPGGWLEVRNDADGYRGWVKRWGLVVAGSARVARWRRLARGRVAAPIALVRAGRGRGAGVSPVFFGSRLMAGKRAGRHVAVELPDGRRGWVDAGALAGRARPGLVERALTLLGSPYLWGGRTPAGYDCSGFVQQVLLEQGISLPRDAQDQWRACDALPEGLEARPGDLVFFSRPRERMTHVGLGLGRGLFAHARGWVRLASLDPHNPLYDSEIAVQFRAWARPGGGTRRPL